MKRYNKRGRIVMLLSAAVLIATTSPATAGIGFGSFGAFFGGLHGFTLPSGALAKNPVTTSQVTVKVLGPVSASRDVQLGRQDNAALETKINFQSVYGTGMISDDMGKLEVKASP